jgi:hypothetical protein
MKFRKIILLRLTTFFSSCTVTLPHRGVVNVEAQS